MKIEKASGLKRALFVDRDNTLTYDTGYTFRLDDFAWKPGAIEGLKAFSEAEFLLFIITNQSGIGRGFFTEKDMHFFHERLCIEAANAGAPISDIAFCPHHPKAVIPELQGPCACRKPEPGMILQLAEKWQIDCSQSVVIGDKQSDLAAGHRAGCHSYLLEDEARLDKLAARLLLIHGTAT